MLAVNDPNVVLGAAETRFLKPVRVVLHARHCSSPAHTAWVRYVIVCNGVRLQNISTGESW